MPIWGVDSSSPAHLPANGTRGASLYEYVCRFLSRNRQRFNAKEAPQFWGRYLTQSRPTYMLSQDEKNFLHSHGCRIVLIYNDTCWDQHHDIDCKRKVGERTIRYALTGYDNGTQSAENACQLAASLDAPNGTRIYADLEGWFVDADWIDAWCTEVPDKSRRLGRQYTPGIYGRILVGADLATARRHFRRDPWNVSIEQTISEQERRDRLLSRGFLTLGEGHRSDTSRQPSLESTAAPAPPTRPPIHIWSNMPRYRSGCNEIPDSFEGYSFQGSFSNTVLWQYGMACSNLSRLVDMDLATQEGFDEMWRV
ncbi:glycoside hydrolase domain-containing protein [Methylomarinum vadi]|uniref:glycoside hydrolase domain-containing protein n=1 Tax=Methylomarinum vadi TaxID=438855 RepID=UPI0004DF9232|nr:glycoside hydrolase domain-containing protein [Methylomarinum vadi]